MAAKFAKNLIPHTAITNTYGHHSIHHNIDHEEGHQIVNVIKAHSRDWMWRKPNLSSSILVTVIAEEIYQSLINYSQRDWDDLN